jgi:hypothetical protein
MHARIRPSGMLKVTIRWGGRYVIDHTDVVIKDGVGGSLLPGNHLTFTGIDLVNRARLRGVRRTSRTSWTTRASAGSSRT